MPTRLAAFLLLSLAVPALAQTPGACAPGTAEADLDVGDVRAPLFNGGSLFFGYVVPIETGHSPLYAGSVWVGGLVNDSLRVAGATYQHLEFWPGPLEPGGTLPDPNNCSAFDRIWVVSAEDIAAYEASGTTTADLLEWPVALGAAVVDGDGIEGNYDLPGGDRPRVYGSQTAFWVMNDVGNEHLYSESLPIGLEVQVTAFAISSPEPALNQATIYRYRLINRNTLPLSQAHITFWTDPDLGSASDDYAGVDSTRSLGFAYNATNDDGVYNIPPAVGFDLLQGAGSFLSFFNAAGPTGGNPTDAQSIYHTQRGLWQDGTPITASGTGYMTEGPTTRWAYPGDPVTGQCWSNVNDCEGGTTPAGNQYALLSSPAFDLMPGEARTFDLAILFAQGTSNLDSITELRAASDRVQAAYDDGSLFDTRLPVASEGHAANPSTLRLDAAYPNPVRDRATVVFSVAEPGPVRLAVYDVLGRRVRTLVEGPLAAGDHTAAFDAAELPSGIYLIVLEAGGVRQTRKVLLAR